MRVFSTFFLIILFAVIIPAGVMAEKITIGYVNVMDDAQVMVAYEAGYYKEAGLDAKLVQFSSGTDLIKGIVGGSIDAGVLGFTNALSWASRGADLKIVGGAQRGYHSLLVQNSLGIDSVEDLGGYSLASQKQGSTADIVLENIVLKQAGLKRSDVGMRYVSPSLAVQSLVAGNADAAFLFEPYARLARYTADVKEIYEIGETWPFPCMVVITSGKSWSQRTDVIVSALEAQKKAIQLLQSDSAAASKLIRKYFIATETVSTLSGEVSSDRIIAEAIEANSFDWELTDSDRDRIVDIKNIMVEQKLLNGEVDLDRILDLSWQNGRL